MVVGVLSSASTSLTPFFFPLFLGFLSLSLFLSFSLFSLFLLSDLGTQFLLISWISLANSVPTDISLEGLRASPVAPRIQVVGHEGTNGHLGGLIVVVIVDESYIDIGSRLVHGSFPARPLANVVDVTVAGPQPAGVVEVPVLLEHLLSNPLQDLVAAHPRRDGLQTDGLAAHVTLIKVGGPGHGTLRWTRTGEQAGKALRSQGHHYARVM